MKRKNPSESLAERVHFIQDWWNRYHWWIISFLIVLTFCLGYTGFRNYSLQQGSNRSFLDYIYLTFQLFVLESGAVAGPRSWHLEAARFLAPSIAAYTAIQAVLAIFKDQIRLFRLRFYRNHVIICGLGRKGFLLAKRLRNHGDKVVVIEINKENQYAGQCRNLGIIILNGNSQDPGILRQARTPRAKFLFGFTGDDSTNSETAVHAYEMLKKQKGHILCCFIHIKEPRLCDLLKAHSIITEKADSFRLEFVNAYDSGARVLLKEYPAFREDSSKIGPSPHFAIIGFGSMGKSLLLHAARDWKNRSSPDEKMLKVTIIDFQAANKTQILCHQYPQLDKLCDLVPLDINFEGLEFQQAEFLNSRPDIKIIYICVDDSVLALTTALSLIEKLRVHNIPVVVRTNEEAGIARILQGLETRSGFENIHTFGFIERVCRPDMILAGIHEKIAQSLHTFYLSNKPPAILSEKDIDFSIPWDDLPDPIKEINRRFADSIGNKMAVIDCHIMLLANWEAHIFEFTAKEIDLLSRMENDRWRKDMESRGWRLGEHKVLRKKRHPYLIPWDDLPDTIKQENRDIIKNLPGILADVDLQIFRAPQKSD
jgi:hypothetical protein